MGLFLYELVGHTSSGVSGNIVAINITLISIWINKVGLAIANQTLVSHATVTTETGRGGGGWLSGLAR